MAKNIKVKGDEVEIAVWQILNGYGSAVVDKLNAATEAAAKSLVEKTNKTAPKRSGGYRKAISCKLLEKRAVGDVWIWYVKEPRHRLTHLLVHGHRVIGRRRKKERTKTNPFLHNATAEVERDYVAAIEKAVQEAEPK